jgi:7-carboxy-7-deazaguanine synthase
MCDTLYAVLPEYTHEWKPMTTEQVYAEIQRLSGNAPILVTLSGGNPAIQPLGDLIERGRADGYTFALETQGSINQPWFARLHYLTLSPKTPGMLNPVRTNWERFNRCLSSARSGADGDGPSISLKMVIFDEADYTYAKDVAAHYPDLPVYLQAGNHTPPHLAQEVDISGILNRLDWLIGRVIEDHWYDARVLPQLHLLLWGNRRGV